MLVNGQIGDVGTAVPSRYATVKLLLSTLLTTNGHPRNISTTTLRASNIQPNNNALNDHQPASAGTDAQSGATYLRMQPPDSSATNG